MPVIQEAFYIPPDITTGLATGLYRRIGGIVRYASGPHKGQIVKHLDPVNIQKAEEATGALSKIASAVKSNRKILIVGGSVLIIASGGAIIYNRIKNHEPSVVVDFRKALSEYIDAVRSGTVDLSIINDLLDSLDKMKQHKNFDKLSIKLSADDIIVLIEHIYNYTVKLAKDNNYNWENDENTTIINPIESLIDYLSVQKQIFESVA